VGGECIHDQALEGRNKASEGKQDFFRPWRDSLRFRVLTQRWIAGLFSGSPSGTHATFCRSKTDLHPAVESEPIWNWLLHHWPTV